MLRRDWQLGTLVVLVVLAASAWSQTARYAVPAASVGDGFSANHQALDSAADLALANIAREAGNDPISGLTADRPPQPSRAILQHFAQQYWNADEESVRDAVDRVTRLRATLDPILSAEGVPDDMLAVVLVESGGRKSALSPKGARGLWQFMPDTARRYGLEVTADRDERIEIAKSTRAAARYLRDLYQRFGDWRLAFAAYNAGEQAVERAVARTGHRDFSRIERDLPAETRNYVPAVMNAMHLLGSNQEQILRAIPSDRSPARSLLYASTESTE
jgi:soluble lytic murein transglycosylase-like protein